MKRYQLIYLLIFSLLYITLRVIHFMNVPTNTSYDTGSYVQTAKQSIFSQGFWNGIRPFTYPLIIKVFNFNLDSLVVGQFILSISVWIWFAFIFSRLLSSHLLRLFSFVFILLFSLSTDVILWDRLAQTESLNISMIIIFFSIFFYNVYHGKKIPAFVTIILSFFWVFLRDTNAWYVLFFGLLLIGFAILHKSTITKYILPIVLISFFILSNQSASIGRRWVVPFLNVLSSRILTNTDYLHEFELRGIPENSALFEQKGKNFSQDYFTNPNLEDFRQWLFKDGKKAYLSFLLRNPSYFFQAPFENWSYMFGYLPYIDNTTNLNLIYSPLNFREILPYTISEIIYPKKFGLIFILISLVLTGFLLFQNLSPKTNSGLLFCLAILICSYPMFILTYHGDGSGMSRHAVGTILPLVLTCWLVVFQLLDKNLNRKMSVLVEVNEISI